MYSLVRVLVVVLIFHGGTASLFSVVNPVSSQLNSLTSQLDIPNNLNLSDFLGSLAVTEDGLWDLNSLIQKFNLSSTVNTTNILSRLNVTTSADGRLDLKNLFQNFNLTDVNLKDVLGLLNVNILDGVLDFTDLIQKIRSSGSLTDYLESIIINTSEDSVLDFSGLAEKYIGTVEEYDVTTDDGYILKVFRIPGDTSKVVLCSHGFFGSSDDFIIRGNTSLAYLLAQSGYDIWVMNYRGSRYSRNHETLDPNTDDQFWQFSMQEMGYYDLSAVIDFILDYTGQKKLSVVGHSEGTAAVFVLTSIRTEYNDKIKIFVALSPVCYLSDTGLVLRVLLRFGIVLTDILKAFDYQELLGYESTGRKLLQLLCSQGQIGYDLCLKGVISALFGYNPNNLEPEFFITLLGHVPAGTGLKNLVHYVQVGNDDRFAKYNYGLQNYEIYGSLFAPNYDFQRVTCNVSLFGGKNDKILGLKDFDRVTDQVPNLVNSIVIQDEQFDHLDFVYGQNAHIKLYPQVIDELNAHN